MTILELRDALNTSIEKGQGNLPIALGNEGYALKEVKIEGSAFMQAVCYLLSAKDGRRKLKEDA